MFCNSTLNSEGEVVSDKPIKLYQVSSVVGSNHGLGALSVVGGRSVTSGGSNDVNPFSGSSSTSLFSKTAEKVKVNGEEKVSSPQPFIFVLL